MQRSQRCAALKDSLSVCEVVSTNAQTRPNWGDCTRESVSGTAQQAQFLSRGGLVLCALVYGTTNNKRKILKEAGSCAWNVDTLTTA